MLKLLLLLSKFFINSFRLVTYVLLRKSSLTAFVCAAYFFDGGNFICTTTKIEMTSSMIVFVVKATFLLMLEVT